MKVSKAYKGLVGLVGLMVIGVNSMASEKTYFIKSGDSMKTVDKYQAVRAKIIEPKTEVLACQEQYVTKKATLKAISTND